MKTGAFTFVLHSHLPYVRQAGRWPHGEEMLHQAVAETYVPLLDALTDLVDEGFEPRLTLGITPILMEQLSDPDVLSHFEDYVEERLSLLSADARRYAGVQPELEQLAGFFSAWYQRTLVSFRDRFGRDLVGAFRKLLASRHVDIITCAATHAYLPLLNRDSSIYAQLRAGAESYARHMGRAPRGVWLPECAYRPGYLIEGAVGVYRPGIEDFLADLNLGYFFTDTHVILGTSPSGKAAGDAVGPYGGLPVRRTLSPRDERAPAAESTTMRPYWVRGSSVAVFGRDARTGRQVWSAAEGYPGDPAYREFHRKDEHSGAQYWRVTGLGVELDQKALYDPRAAQRRVQAHAEHFCSLVAAELAEFRARSETPGIVVAAYDTELFGHWWYEGVDWLKAVLRRLRTHPDVELTTARAYLEAYPPTETLDVPESSWGTGGDHSTWFRPETGWLWDLLHDAERRMEEAVSSHPDAAGERLEVLNQTARELLLLEASDWPFLMTTGQATEYATGRFQAHLARFYRLATLADRDSMSENDLSFVRNVSALDNPFPALDYRLFARREGGKEQGTPNA